MINTVVSAAIIVFSLFILLWRIKPAERGKLFNNYFSVARTRSIKGMGAIFILFSHICSYLGDTFRALLIFKNAGGLMVAGVLFVSGYGLQYGVMNKKGYLKSFFRKRMPSILVPYYIVNLFYINTNHPPVREIILSYFGWNTSLWYVTAILILYICFFLCAKLFAARRLPFVMAVCVVIYMIVMNRLGFGSWWYKSCPSFAVGMWLCAHKNRFRRFFSRGYPLKALCVIMATVLSYGCCCIWNDDTKLAQIIISAVGTTMFSVMLAVISMKIKIKNPIINFFGNMSLEIYLTHGLWIAWLKMGVWHDLAPEIFDNDALFFAGILVGTLIMSFLVHIISGFILKLLSPRAKSIEKSAQM